MARMLQALKNLEAKSARPASGAAAPRPDTSADDASAPPVTPPPSWTGALAAAPAIETAAPAARETFSTLYLAEPPPFTPALELPATPRGPRLSPPAPATGGPWSATEAPPATAAERAAQRVLGDPVRSAPLVQLAERLRRDREQMQARTLLLVGVGERSATHDTALHVAALLAQPAGGGVLLIDADLARHALSKELECSAAAGLAERVTSADFLAARPRPTLWPGLALLPAGQQPHCDLSAHAPRLEAALRELAEQHSLVLLDGGRTSDPAAAALAKLCDATYFLVQLGAVEADEARAALRDFRAAGARVVGCIAT